MMLSNDLYKEGYLFGNPVNTTEYCRHSRRSMNTYEVERGWREDPFLAEELL